MENQTIALGGNATRRAEDLKGSIRVAHLSLDRVAVTYWRTKKMKAAQVVRAA
jgi:hypothetical protein